MSRNNKPIGLLFIFAVVLFILNIVLKLFYAQGDNSSNLKKTSVSVESIIKKVQQNNLDFSLTTDLIKQKGSKTKNLPQYSLQIPRSFPTYDYIANLNKALKYDGILLRANEIENKKIQLNFLKVKDSLLTITLLPAQQTFDQINNYMSFFISGTEGLDSNEVNYLFRTDEHFDLIFIPSSSSINTFRNFKRFGKRYSLLINDEMDETRFILDQSFTPKRLRLSIDEIFSEFPSPDFIFIDIESGVYKSSIYPFIEKEFQARKKTLIQIRSSSFLKGSLAENQNYLNSLIRSNHATDSIIVCSAKLYLDMKDFRAAMIRKGFLFNRSLP